ncbi:hypothetical protein D9M70_467450 [compost metagenome]
MNVETKKQLELNQKLGDRIENIVCYVMCMPLLLGCVTTAGFLVWSAMTVIDDFEQCIKLMTLAVLFLLLGGALLQAAGWIIRRLQGRFAPSFIIDDSDPNVVKLYGSIRLDGSDKAEEMLLKARPGLMLHRGSAFKDFGCTLAAVPATSGFIQAKAELQKLGVSIS